MANQGKGVSRRELLRWAAAGGATAAGGFLFGDDTENVKVEHQRLELPRWNAPGFRAAVVSDLHVDSERERDRAVRAIRMAIAERPDVILMPGDLVNRSDPVRRRLLKDVLVACGEASCPVLATLGNHDYWSQYPPAVIRSIERSSVRLLRNEKFELDGVTIAGIDDAIAGRHRPDVLRAGHESKSLLAMLHEPDYVEDMPTHVSLQVSGHSHGGQVRLPMGLALHTPKGARRYIDGFYPNARVPLFVSRGVGTTGPNWRLFCPPQVAILEFV